MDFIEDIRTLPYEGSLSTAQLWLLTGVNTFSSYLSLTASCWLFFIIYREPEWFSFERIMAFGSIWNVLQCIGIELSPFMVPHHGIRIFLFGNDHSCDAAGFLMQSGVTVPLYSVSLSFYYLLRVRYEVDKLKLAQKYEWALHVFPICFAYGTATLGLFFNLYEELNLGLGCWISGGLYHVWVWTFLGLPLSMTIIIVLGCTISVCLVSHRMMKRNNTQKQANRLYPVDITKPDPRIVRQEANQCALYAISCIICIVWMLLLRLLDEAPSGDRRNAKNYYVLTLLAYFMYPLKGVMDFLIFLRPAIRKKKQDKSVTTLAAFGQVLFGDRSTQDLSHISFDAQSQSSISSHPGLSEAAGDTYGQSFSSFNQTERSRPTTVSINNTLTSYVRTSLSPSRFGRGNGDAISLRSIDLDFSLRQTTGTQTDASWSDSILG